MISKMKSIRQKYEIKETKEDQYESLKVQDSHRNNDDTAENSKLYPETS